MPWPGLTSNTPCGRSSVTVARPRGNSTRFRVHDSAPTLEQNRMAVNQATLEIRQPEFGSPDWAEAVALRRAGVTSALIWLSNLA